MRPAFAHMATLTITTERNPAIAGGKRGPRATHLQNVKVLPLMPATAATLANPVLQGTAVELWETYCGVHQHTDGAATVTQIPDIRQGDVIVSGGEDYLVRYVGNWPAVAAFDAYLHIVVEENKP